MIKKMVKREFYLPHDELLDGKSRRPSSSIHRALSWRRRTPTATAEKDDVRGRREDGVGEAATAKRFVAGVVVS